MFENPRSGISTSVITVSINLKPKSSTQFYSQEKRKQSNNKENQEFGPMRTGYPK